MRMEGACAVICFFSEPLGCAPRELQPGLPGKLSGSQALEPCRAPRSGSLPDGLPWAPHAAPGARDTALPGSRGTDPCYPPRHLGSGQGSCLHHGCSFCAGYFPGSAASRDTGMDAGPFTPGAAQSLFPGDARSAPGGAEGAARPGGAGTGQALGSYRSAGAGEAGQPQQDAPKHTAPLLAVISLPCKRREKPAQSMDTSGGTPSQRPGSCARISRGSEADNTTPHALLPNLFLM